MTSLGRAYAWASPDYILKKMTWQQVMKYYAHYVAYETGKPVEDEEPDAIDFPGTIVKPDGSRVYSK